MSTITAYKTLAGIGMDDACFAPAPSGLGQTVFVLFTSVNETLAALKDAQLLARPMGAKILIVAVQVVPRPLQLDEPPVSLDFLIREFEEKAAGFLANTQISVYLCRDREEALQRVLNPNSPVVVGIRKRWLPTRGARLAKRLRRIGYNIVTVNPEGCNA